MITETRAVTLPRPDSTDSEFHFRRRRFAGGLMIGVTTFFTFLTLLMYRYSQQPYPERIQQAWTMAMVVMVFVLLANVAARLVVYWQQRRIGKL